jgi:hypothetical protein
MLKRGANNEIHCLNNHQTKFCLKHDFNSGIKYNNSHKLSTGIDTEV